MFEEASFDEESDTAPATSSTWRTLNPSSASPTTVRRSAANYTIRFHRPGEVGFCAVAGAGDDSLALLDSRTVSGDSWISDECHCTRCECLRVIQKMESVDKDVSHCKKAAACRTVLLLLDMDNFGFNQFKSVPPGSTAEMDNDGASPLSRGAEGNPLCHLFVWAFFGSCFTRYHSEWPTEESVCLPLTARRDTDSSTSTSHPGAARSQRPSIWQRLVKMGRVHFTPCAGQSQSADNVIMTVMDAFRERDVILLTGDSKLLQDVRNKRRIRGRKSRRDNEMDMMSDRLTLIDANDHDKRFVPVWRELVQCVAQIVRHPRAEDAMASGPAEDGRRHGADAPRP